jgi:hypothetical protein
MSNKSIKAGAALVTNTMLVQSAHFVENPLESESVVEAFFDLCSLIEAVILRRNILTMEGDISPEQFSSLPLISELKKSGVLQENMIPLDPNGIQRELAVTLGTEVMFTNLSRVITLNVPNMLPDAFPDEANLVIADKNAPEYNRACFMRAVSHPDASETLTHPSNVFEFFRSGDFIEFLRGTGASKRGAYVLRTYLYSYSARKACITFMPDYPRIPFLASMLDKFYESVVTKDYKELARKLRCEAKDFLEDARPLGLPIPPFTALVLSKCESTKDIVNVLLDLREEFKPLREGLAVLEESLLNSTNIGERNKARHHVEAVFTATSKKYDQTGLTTFKRLVDFSGEIVAPAFNWTNPTSYSASLIKQPVEWLRDWWYRRPLAQFFGLAKQFHSIREYNKLVGKVFKIEFRPQEIHDFEQIQLTLLKIFASDKKDLYEKQ